MMLSVVIPVYNEEKTILKTIETLKRMLHGYELDIIVVDDGSTDGTQAILAKLNEGLRLIRIPFNQGKGCAVKAGLTQARGDIAFIQDADLEYDPADVKDLIKPIIEQKADVVFGSRFIGSNAHRVLYNTHYVANRFLTLLSNLFSNLNLSDMEAGYKAFSRKAIKQILPCLSAKRFGIEVELVAEVAKHRLRTFEVGISYSGRTYAEGKKINWLDGLAAIWHIVNYNIFKSCQK